LLEPQLTLTATTEKILRAFLYCGVIRPQFFFLSLTTGITGQVFLPYSVPPYPLFCLSAERQKKSEVIKMTEKSAGKRYYLSEFSFWDGDKEITFNIAGFTTDMQEISVAVSCEGKVSVCMFDLKSDEYGRLFFEYGLYSEKIALNDFEQIEEVN
jgi:hypothetical protein